jgi:glutaredoxin
VSAPPLLTLYSKPGCHLCEDLAQLLADVQTELGFAVEEIDITRDAALFARYRYEIPILRLGEMEIARGNVDERDLLKRLEAAISR